MRLLQVDNVRFTFEAAGGGRVRAVDGISLHLDQGETLGLIGESGSGKSTVGRLAIGLLQPESGSVIFRGQPLSRLSAGQLRRLRSKVQIVFQEPLQSLDPRMRVGSIIEEPLLIHERLSRHERRKRVDEVLDRVSLSKGHIDRYPRQLSGGEQQRVGIARAIITRPMLLVLDEPTSSLDLSVRALILALLADLQNQMGLSYLLISHDIATVVNFCRRTAVMYLGRIVEVGPTTEVTGSPRHPYTKALLSATLSVDPSEATPHFPLHGDPPRPDRRPTGCPLVGRCPIEITECSARPVALTMLTATHAVACIRVGSNLAGDSATVVARA